jgi:hypothetical protein
MTLNDVPFKWAAAKEQAAQSVAEGILTEAEIAAAAGIRKRQLERWKKEPAFAERFKAIVADLTEASRQRTIGRRDDRVEALQARWDAMRRIIADRAADPVMASIPGGRTGLIVVREAETVMEDAVVNGVAVKVARVVPTQVAVDTGLLKELREHEKQAAQELGQWSDRHEYTGAGGKDLIPPPLTLEQFRSLTADEKIQFLRGQLGFSEAKKTG